jgi:hypothetical protein
MYMNGTLVSTTNTAGSAIYYGSNDQPHIGAMTDCGGQNNYFNGSIDEVMVFNKTLTATEINSLYQFAKPN